MLLRRRSHKIMERKIYFAGDLFDHKDITGNLLLAEKIGQVSNGAYKVVLPQDSESNDLRTVNEIRDRDLELLFSCDCIVANFDGNELDSGTVVEFCFSKMLDMPAVLLRSDFRVRGDNGSDPWNLMCSGYPRSKVLIISAMEQYHRMRKKNGNPAEIAAAMHHETASMIVDALDTVFREKSHLDSASYCAALELATASAGGILPELFPKERISQLASEKVLAGFF